MSGTSAAPRPAVADARTSGRGVLKVSPAEVSALLSGAGALQQVDFDEMAVPTYTHRNPLARWVFWQRHRRVLRLAQLRRADAVLDFGTGVGALLPSLCAAAGTVHATDLRDALVRELVRRRVLPVTFHLADGLARSLPDHALDVIIAADVLEHIEEPALSGYLRLFADKLKPGGRLIVSLPTENVLYRLGRVAVGFAGRGDYHRTDWRSLMVAARACGYRESRRVHVPLPGPGCLFVIARFELS